MASLTLKGLPEELLERLREQARVHRRSLNQEALIALEAHSRRQPIAVEEFLARVRKHREAIGGGGVTLEALDAAKREGRP